MTSAPTTGMLGKPKLWVPGDWNAFFGFGTNILVNLLTLSALLRFVLQMPDEAWFNVNMMQKDLVLALELGRELDVPLPTTSVTNEMMTAARGSVTPVR